MTDTLAGSRFPGVVLFSEIYQVTGPVARFARQIAGHGFIVAAPSSYHGFVGPKPFEYDVEGTSLGNDLKIKKVRRSPIRASCHMLISLDTRIL